MSWATTFNSGNMGNNLSNKMANIKLDTTVDTAEIQAKINEHFKPVQTTGQTTNVQNNSQMQPQTTFNGGIQQDTFVQNNQMAQNQTFVPYQLQAPNYQTIPNNAGAQYVGPMQYYNPSYQNVQTYYPQNSGYMAQAPQYQPVQNVQTYQPQQVETAYSQNAVETASGVGQKLNTSSATYVPNFDGLSEGSFEKLQTSYIEAKASQGLISKGIDTIKSLFSMKGTSKSAKKAIENYQMGTISYNEAMKEIENFEEKSKTSTDSITSAISAIGAFAGASIMKAKGGTTAKMFALAVGLGAGIKTLMGIGERGTNQLAGDTLDATKLAKDLAQGSINGAITGGVSIVSAKPSMVSTTSSGALTGTISGSLMGVSDYSINCIDENKEFSINDMIIQSLKYAVGGLMLGAGTGALTGKVLNKKITNVDIKTGANADDAVQNAAKGAKEAKAEYKASSNAASGGAAEAPKQKASQKATNSTKESAKTAKNSQGTNAQGAAASAKASGAEASSELTFANIEKAMKTNKAGRYSSKEVLDDCTGALQKAMKLEKDPEILSLYEQFQKAATAKEKSRLLGKMYKKVAIKYHPDVTTVDNAADAFNLYSNIFGSRGKTGGKKGLLYYYAELAQKAA